MCHQEISSKIPYVSPSTQWVADHANITTSLEMLPWYYAWNTMHRNDTMHEISQIIALLFPK